MLNIVLCDDNSQFLCLLKKVVERECSKIVPKGEEYSVGPAFGRGKDVLTYIKDHPIDVLLLDIDMPDLSGFELAKVLCKEYQKTKIIFVSAYDNFVYSSFEYYPFGYLRKDHIAEELPTILNRIVEKMHESKRQIQLTTSMGVKQVDVNAVTYIESNRNYCSVNLIHGKQYICRGTLTSFETRVSDYDFFRIHSAYLINFEHVERMLDNGFVLVHNTSLPVAQRRMQDFKKAYMNYTRRFFGT